MANNTVRQNKLRRLVFAPETTLGTAETLDATSPVVPATSVTFAPTRGSRVISRAALIDGFHGEAPGAIGSWAWQVDFSSEIHHDSGYVADAYDVYWVQLLLGCGFKAEDNGTDTITMYPTMAPISDYSAGGATDGFTNPTALSFGFLQNNTDANDETAVDTDAGMFARGCVGNVNFSLQTGQIAQLNCSFKGLVVDDQLIRPVANAMSIGDFSQLGASPYVVRDAVLTFTDNATANPVVTYALTNLEVSMNANVPDVESANVSGNYGFEVSPVFWDESPSVSFQLAETQATDDVVLQRLFSGDTFAITLTLANPDVAAATIQFSFPTLQQTDVTLGDNGGYATYQINGKCVRAVGDGTNDSLMQVIYTYA